MSSTIGFFDRPKSTVATARRTHPVPTVVLATLALALLIAGCITPSDPRQDDSDVDGVWSQAGVQQVYRP
jgi:hypothetical protein